MTTETTTATGTATLGKSICLPCPRCGEANASLSLQLWNEQTFHCAECDAEFTAAEVAELLERWAPVIKWLAGMPGE